MSVLNPPRIVVFICKGNNGGPRHYWSEDQTQGESRNKASCPECNASAEGKIYGEGDMEKYRAYMLQLSKTAMIHIHVA